ncbi:hypothetical protein HMPREF9144_1306 [Prevotella pallens ATCC 700821]|jgi:hypothetical protein|uniref:Uncharacterized protein n=1 Tax=Prevotella pallens ATCC 700821 TaxID=997353 RepID=F9DI16_9BACT|nr:hypothetical protein HMPREF9144_1306 [Prevotella pallens ATCC 700821]
MPPTPFMTEVKYREFFLFNLDGVIAIFEHDMYLFGGVITGHILNLPIIVVVEQQLG